MVLRLTAALQVPPHERNSLLLAAGYAPLHSRTNLAEPGLEPSGDVDFFIAQLDPNPVLILDRYWNIVRMNEGARRIFALFRSCDSLMPLNGPRLIFHPQGLRPFIENWDAVAACTIQRVHNDAANNPSDDKLKRLVDELINYPNVPVRWRKLDSDFAPRPFLTTHFKWKNSTLRLFSTLVTLSIPLDVVWQELRIESFFPADQGTRSAVNRLAKGCALSQTS